MRPAWRLVRSALASSRRRFLAGRTAPEELDSVPFERKSGVAFDRRQRLGRQAGSDFDDPAAARAGDMVMVRVAATHPIAVAAVSEIDTVEHPLPHQHLDGAEDCRPPELRVMLLEFVPQIIGREVVGVRGVRCQTFSDEAARTRIAQAALLERR